MRIIIDADACPVIDEILAVTEIPVILVRNFNHFTAKDYPDNVTVTYVDDSADSADYKIIALAHIDDIVVTQDYGLASLLIAKGVRVMHHNGMVYHADNINHLLEIRHQSSQMRKAGLRTRGPKKLTAEDRQHFKEQLTQLINHCSSS